MTDFLRDAAADPGKDDRRPAPARVTIVDVDISCWNLAAFLVKLVVASLPAAVVAYLTYGLAYAFLTHGPPR
jgi:hypothetical protein